MALWSIFWMYAVDKDTNKMLKISTQFHNDHLAQIKARISNSIHINCGK